MIRRRRVLQLSGSFLVALSLHNCISSPSSLIQKKLLRRQRTDKTRRLALLVGINDYSTGSQIPSLRGCLTDVELQRNLLIHRYGFVPTDIVTLTNGQATRRNILEAFERHLIQQTKSGDVVVFHYSGHGSQIADPDRDFADGLVSTLVPADSSRVTAQGPISDITGHTLFLLMAALPTENVTVVLDCCYSGGGKRGNLQVRAITGGLQYQVSPEELAYQQRWLSQLDWSAEEFKQYRRQGVAKGVVITATNRDQLAADVAFDGFSAGAFTYLMTQSLWQQEQNPSVELWLPTIAHLTQQLSFTRQRPELEAKLGSQNEKRPVYFIEQSLPPAEAVLTQTRSNWAEFWLGGVDAWSLAAFSRAASFAIVDQNGQIQGQVQVESRQGLVGQGRLLPDKRSSNWQLGNFLQEQVRSIPGNLVLKIGLDASLGNNISEAQTALQAYKRFKALPLQQEEVHCILGRMPPQSDPATRKDVTYQPLPGSLGLFTPGREVILNSFGAQDESVVQAVQRLGSKFKALLATRLIRLVLNPNSSRLQITASLKLAHSQGQILATATPLRGSRPGNPPVTGVPISQTRLPMGKIVQLTIGNNETQALYISVLTINANQDITLLFPYQWKAIEIASRIESGQTLVIPDPKDGLFELQTREPRGLTEILVIASSNPLRNTLKGLQTIALRRGQTEEPLAIDDPLELMVRFLFDLKDSSISRGNAQNMTQSNATQATIADSGENLPIDMRQIAILSINLEII